MKAINDIIKPVLATTIILLSFAYFFLVEKENPQILIAIVGMDGAVIGYYFGASSGGVKKDETIQSLLDNKK